MVVGRADVGRVEVQEVLTGAIVGVTIPVVTVVASVAQEMIAGVDVTTTNKIQKSSIKGAIKIRTVKAVFYKEVTVIYITTTAVYIA